MKQTDKVICQHVTGMLPIDVSFETCGGIENFAALLVADNHVTLHRPDVERLCGYMTAWLEETKD